MQIQIFKRVQNIATSAISLFVYVSFATLCAQTHAQTTYTWKGSVSSDWYNTANWTPVGVPGSKDTANFNSGSISLSAPLTFGGTFNWSGGSLSGSFQITTNGTVNWSGGTLNNRSSLTVASNSVLNITAGVTVLGALTNYGTVNWQAGSIVIDNNNGVNWSGSVWNQVGAAWNIQCDQSIFNYGGSPAFYNAGTIIKSGTTGTTIIYPYYSNPGSVVVTSGTLQFGGGGLLAGNLQAATNAAIDFIGGTFNQTGPVNLQGSVNVIAGGMGLNSPLTGPLNWTGGAITGTLNGTLNWSGGQIANETSLIVASNSVLNITAGVTVLGPLTNYGTVNWQAGSIVIDNNNGVNWSGSVWNQGGAAWNIQCDQSIYNYGGSPAFYNAGTIIKSGTTGTTSIYPYFSNPGSVVVTSGTLQFGGGGLLDGNLQAATNAAIDFASGSFSQNGLVNLQGSVNVIAGGMGLNSPFTGPLNWTGGAITGTLNGTLNCSGGQIANETSLTVASNSVLNITAGVTVLGALTNYGTVNWQAGSIVIDNNNGVNWSGSVWNQGGAVWNIQCDQSMFNYGGSPAFYNGGNLLKTAAGNTTTIGVAFYNTGTVIALNGTIQFLSFNTTGSFNNVIIGNIEAVGTNAAINFNGSTLVYGLLNSSGRGSINFGGGSVSQIADTAYTLQSGNSQILINPLNQDGIFSWLVNGVDQLNQKWFWVRQGSTGSQNSLDNLGIGYLSSYSSTNLTVNYNAQGFKATLSLTLQGGTTGSTNSQLYEVFTIQNTGIASTAFHTFEYSDFDLAGNADGDLVSFNASNTMTQQGKGVVATESASNPSSYWETSWYGIISDGLDDITPLTLADENIPNQPGDQTYAFQWDVTLSPGQIYSIALTNSIAPIYIAPVTIGLLNITLRGANAYITWPTNVASVLQLQSASSLGVNAVWNSVTNQPAVTNAYFMVDVPCAAKSQFYRLQP